MRTLVTASTMEMEVPRERDTERGAALVIVIFASTLILLLLLTALTMTRMSGRMLARRLALQGQATNAASAGLTEALSWFVHQRQQPVTAFDPKVDAGGVCTHVPPHAPAANESEQPAVGIVRSYQVTSTGKVYGRYEVRRNAVTDVSTRRGKPQAGLIWQLESEGTIYVRNNPADAPGVGANTILSRRTMRVEIQRLGLQLPANAAINSIRGDNTRVTRPSRILGGAAGIGVAHPPSTGNPGGNGTISGNPSASATNGSFNLENIFSVSQNELLAMADLVVDDERQLPNPMPAMSLIVIRGNATFNGTRKFNGSGIVVVFGNLILNPQSDPSFSGVIWVGGNLNIHPPALINGSIVARGNVQVAGGSEVAEINYDPAILDQIRLQMGNYLYSRSPWIVTPSGS
jgi:hypothetical protein